MRCPPLSFSWKFALPLNNSKRRLQNFSFSGDEKGLLPFLSEILIVTASKMFTSVSKIDRNCMNSKTRLFLALAVYLSMQTIVGEGCHVDINLANGTGRIDFLKPEGDGREFLACFSGLEKSPYALTLFFHEFYLAHTSVSVCTTDLLDIDDSSQYDIDDRCDVYQPRCDHILTFNDSRYLNVTLPPRYEYYNLPPELLGNRSLFNITYYHGPPEFFDNILHVKENSLMYCNLNGIPTLYKEDLGTLNKDDLGNYSLGCECQGNASGDRCQWGGECLSADNNGICSNHGQCKYQGGDVVCSCNHQYVGRFCQLKKTDVISSDKNCGKRLECQHKCHMWNGTPFCSCYFGFIQNGTLCHPAEFLWDVTVKFDGQHNSTSIKNQTLTLLRQLGLQDTQISTSLNSSRKMKVHFTVSDELKSKLPSIQEWENLFNTNVTLENKRRFPGVKLEALEQPDSNIALRCSVNISLPVVVKWYKDSYLILVLDVTSSIHTNVEYESIKVQVDKDLSERIQIDVLIMNYDPMIDWGTYRCEVTKNHKTIANSSLINGVTQPFEVDVTPKIITIKKYGNLSLLCSTKNTWYGGDMYSMAWKLSPKDAVGEYESRLQHWNGSTIRLYNITESVNLTCYVQDYNCTGDTYVVARVLVWAPDDLLCPANSTDNMNWPAMIAGEVSVVECPEGFHGKCSRRCLQEDDNTTAWALPDYSQCIYSPLMEIASDPEVLLQGRGYPFAIRDASKMARTLIGILQERTIATLPNEASSLIDLLRKLISSCQNPLSFHDFVEILQYMTGMFPPTIKTSLALHNLKAKFMNHAVRDHRPQKPVREFHNLSAHLEWNLARGSSFFLNTPGRPLCGSMDIEVSRIETGMGSDPILNVGVMIYLHPRLLIPNITGNRRRLYGNESPVELIDISVLEVLAITLDPTHLSSPQEEIISNITYYSYQTAEQEVQERYPDTYRWSKVCGQILFEGDESFSWDLSPCSQVSDDEQHDAFKCRCKGQGLFGLFLKAVIPRNVTIDREGDVTSVVLASCFAMLAIFLLAVVFLKCWWPRYIRSNQVKWLGFPKTDPDSGGNNFIQQNSELIIQTGCCRNNCRHTSTNITMQNNVVYQPSNFINANISENAVHDEAVGVTNETDNVYMDMCSNEYDEANKTNIGFNGVDVTENYHTRAKCETSSDSVSAEKPSCILPAKEPQHMYLPMVVRNSVVQQEVH